MGCPFVQFGPQTFGLPVVQSVLQLAVKVPEVFGIEGQVPAELGEVLLHVHASLGLHEQVEQRVSGIDGILVRHGAGLLPPFTGKQEGTPSFKGFLPGNLWEMFTAQSFLFYSGSKVCPGETVWPHFM